MDPVLMQYLLDRQDEILKEAAKERMIAGLRRQPGLLRRQLGELLIQIGTRLKADIEPANLVPMTGVPGYD